MVIQEAETATTLERPDLEAIRERFLTTVHGMIPLEVLDWALEVERVLRKAKEVSDYYGSTSQRELAHEIDRVLGEGGET